MTIITAQVLDISPDSTVTFSDVGNNINKIVGDLNSLNADKADYANTSVFALKSEAAANSYVKAILANTNLYIATKLDSTSYTASDVLTKIKTVDGSGSGLDADTLDGHDTTFFTNATNLSSGTLPDARLSGTYTGISITSTTGTFTLGSVTSFGSITSNSNFLSSTTTAIMASQTGGSVTLKPNGIASTTGQLVVSTTTLTYGGSTVWHSANDGSGSGLDADLLDGHDSSFFLNTGSAVDASTLGGHDASYFLPAASYTAADVLTKLKTVDGTGSGLDADTLDGHDTAYFLAATAYTAADVLAKLKTVDGSGSGINADLLDGNDSSFFTNATNLSSGTVASARISGSYTGITAIGAATFTSSLSSSTTTSIFATSAAGTVYLRPNGAGSATGQMTVASNGNVAASGDITANSDSRIKTNVATLTDALNKVKALRGVSFTRIDNGNQGIGFIAQEVEKIIPEVVSLNEETGLKSIAYGNLVAILVEAIHELAAKIEG